MITRVEAPASLLGAARAEPPLPVPPPLQRRLPPSPSPEQLQEVRAAARKVAARLQQPPPLLLSPFALFRGDALAMAAVASSRRLRPDPAGSATTATGSMFPRNSGVLGHAAAASSHGQAASMPSDLLSPCGASALLRVARASGTRLGLPALRCGFARQRWCRRLACGVRGHPEGVPRRGYGRPRARGAT